MGTNEQKIFDYVIAQSPSLAAQWMWLPVGYLHFSNGSRLPFGALPGWIECQLELIGEDNGARRYKVISRESCPPEPPA